MTAMTSLSTFAMERMGHEGVLFKGLALNLVVTLSGAAFWRRRGQLKAQEDARAELEDQSDRSMRARAYLAVLGHFGGDHGKAVLWFSTPNPLLGTLSPAEMVYRLRTGKLVRFIEERLSENHRGKIE
ncbi:MAG: hypothetical protein IT285_16150 [Bdellovibrionales bacterium]|nr:hypothetical protein [Bdellovibrionales bacterium]